MTSDNENSPHQVDRERGILSKADREYLTGKKELKEQSERDARYRIRNRIENGILDLNFLDWTLDDKDRSRIAQSVFPDNPQGADNIENSFMLLYRMIIDSCDDDVEKAHQRIESSIGHRVERFLQRKYEEKIVTVDIRFDVDFRAPDEDDLIEKYNSWNETFEEFKYLRDNNLVETDEEFWRHLLQHYWREDNILRLAFGDSRMEELDPDDYESSDVFVEAGLEARRTAIEKMKTDIEGDDDTS